jgi:aminoglycoside phosphotransferase
MTAVTLAELAGGAKMMRELPGLSGAHVLLLTMDDRRWFVRKVARDGGGNDRLRRQMAKQLAFAELPADVVRTPKITASGEIASRFYFDMEFVRGTDGISYLRQASYADVVRFADQLCRYFDAAARRDAYRRDAGDASMFDAMYAKLCDVQRRTGAIPHATLVELFLALDRLRAITRLRPTLCHGDPTLENVVVDDAGSVWMVDLLDAPFEHYWQDVAKLHQDLEGGWFLRHQPPIARCVAEYVSRRLVDDVTARDAAYPRAHPVLLAWTFARILPYVRTPDERAFVIQRVEHFARISTVDT